MKADASPVFRLGWGADFPDPHNFMDLFLTKSGNNHTKWGNPKYDSLVQQGSSELNPKKRVSIYNQAQKIMLEQDAAIVPLFNESLNWLVSDRVKGFNLDSMGRLYLKRYSMNENAL
jgi:oligopeptide transport system substrate-binding protein